MQYLEAMKAILPLVLLFLSTTLFAQNIPSIEQVEAELVELKKKDDLRAYTLKLARQRDSLIEVFDRQFFNLEQELSSTEVSLSQLEFDFDNAMTSIEALNQNKEMLENKNSQQAIEISELHAKIIELQTTISYLESNPCFSQRDTLLPIYQHEDAQQILSVFGDKKFLTEYYPEFLGGEPQKGREHNEPLFLTFLIEKKSTEYQRILLLNLNNQIAILPLSSIEEIQSGYRDKRVFKNSTLEANLYWSVLGPVDYCRDLGCTSCDNEGFRNNIIEVYKDGNLICALYVAQCKAW